MKRNEDVFRQLAQKELKERKVPAKVRDSIEETLAALPEREEKSPEVIPLSRRKRVGKWIGSIAAAFLVVFLVLPNTGYPVAQALAQVPVLGTVFQAVTFREYEEETEMTEVKVKTPQVVADDPDNVAAGAISEEIDALNEKAAAQFRKEHANGGYGALEIGYETVCDTDRWYTVKVYREETGADSLTTEDFYTFDKKTGELLILSDLFEKDDYIADLSENVKGQMRAQMKKDDSVDYFLDTDLPEEDFQEIDPNQDFYFDGDGELVLCFDEAEVAPAYMGTVAFKVPQKVYRADLKPEYR